MRFSSSRMKERLGDPACTLPALRQGATRGTLQRWPACEMTTTSPGLRSEDREEHEELRWPSPRGRPQLGLLDPPGGDGQGRSKRQRPYLGKRVKVGCAILQGKLYRVPAQCVSYSDNKCNVYNAEYLCKSTRRVLILCCHVQYMVCPVPIEPKMSY